MRRLVLTFFALLLGNCSSDLEQSSLDAATSYFAPGEYVPASRFTALFNEPRPILDIEFIDLGVAGKLILEQQDGDYARYLSADLGGIVLQNGMLHSINGFGEPLVSAETSQSRALVFAGSAGLANRFHTYLNGEDRVMTQTYHCEIGERGMRDLRLTTGTAVTYLMYEACQSLTNSFENLYWVDFDRQMILQSKQWVGANVGAIVTRITL